MKTVYKCVASLTAIAFVCCALLLLCDALIPKQVFKPDFAKILNDKNVTAESVVKVSEMPSDIDKSVQEVYTVNDGEIKDRLVIKVKSKVKSYGSFSLLVGVQVKSAAEAKILGVVLDDTSIVSNNLYTEPLNVGHNFETLVSDDTLGLSATMMGTGATYTKTAMVEGVKTAYKTAQTFFEKGLLKLPGGTVK